MKIKLNFPVNKSRIIGFFFKKYLLRIRQNILKNEIEILPIDIFQCSAFYQLDYGVDKNA